MTHETEDGDTSDRTDESVVTMELPSCELSKLDSIYSTVVGVALIERQAFCLEVEKSNYIPKLLNLFHICEDLENIEGLGQLCEIFTRLIFHNNASLFQVCEHCMFMCIMLHVYVRIFHSIHVYVHVYLYNLFLVSMSSNLTNVESYVRINVRVRVHCKYVINYY